DVGLGLGRVEDDPGHRDQREDPEQHAAGGQQRDRPSLEAVQLHRDGGVEVFPPFPPAPFPPRLRSGGLGRGVGRPQRGCSHAMPRRSRRNSSEVTEMATMVSPSTTAMAAPRLYWALLIDVLKM